MRASLTFVPTFVYARTCVCVCVCVCACEHACVCVCVRACVPGRVRACVRVLACILSCVVPRVACVHVPVFTNGGCVDGQQLLPVAAVSALQHHAPPLSAPASQPHTIPWNSLATRTHTHLTHTSLPHPHLVFSTVTHTPGLSFLHPRSRRIDDQSQSTLLPYIISFTRGELSLPSLARTHALHTCSPSNIYSPIVQVEEVLARVASPKLFPATTSRYATKGASGYRDSLGLFQSLCLLPTS